MPFLFSDDKPRTCCCGCSLELGIIVFTAIAALEGIFLLIGGGVGASILSFVFAGTGLWTLLAKENTTARVVNFWVWAVMYGIGIIAVAFLTIVLTFGASDVDGVGGIIAAWWIALALQVLLSYWVLGVAWYWIE